MFKADIQKTSTLFTYSLNSLKRAVEEQLQKEGYTVKSSSFNESRTKLEIQADKPEKGGK